MARSISARVSPRAPTAVIASATAIEYGENANVALSRARTSYIRPANASCRAGTRSVRRLVLEVLHGRTLDHAPARVEARAVAGAVPRALGLVPLHLAAEVRADGGDRVERAVVLAVGGDLARAAPHDARLARRQRVDRAHVGAAEVVAHEAHTHVGVLLHELLGRDERLEARRVEERGPRVVAPADQVGQDHARGGAVREAPLHEAGCHPEALLERR